MILVPALLSFAAAVPQVETIAVDAGWTSFRGPRGAGNASGGLPTDLESDAAIEWEAEVPSGYSSPVVTAGRVFVTGADKTHLFTICLDEESGERMWHRKVEYNGKRPGANSSAAPTPAVDGDRVYALFHHVGLVAYDHFGEEVWRNDVGAPFNIPHGLGTSPVLHDGKIVLQLDQDSGSALVCLDAATGEEVWRTTRDGAAHSYSTPVVHAPADGPAILVVSGSYEIGGYSFETGERVWWMTGSAWQSKSVPLIHKDHCIVSAYMPSSAEFGLPSLPPTFEAALEEHDADADGKIARAEWEHDMLHQTWFIWDRDGDDMLDGVDYAYLQSTKTEKGAMFAIKLGGTGDITDTHVAWKFENRRALSDVISPVLVDGTLYLLKDGGIMTAVDAATGEAGKDGRVGDSDQYFASPVAAGGRILTTGGSGLLSVIDAGAEWETIATGKLDAGALWATPALSDGRILVRGTTKLVSIRRPREAAEAK